MAKVNYQSLFDDAWLAKARAKSCEATWANSLIEHWDTSGQTYLATLRLWFKEYPAAQNDKQELHNRLESLQKKEHLGGVNELSWWAFMQHEGINASVLPTAKKASRPDFQLEVPDCFVEVTTLNVSDKDRNKLEQGACVALDNPETVRRVVGKLTDEKRQQLIYAANQKKPAVLVVFDYTEWSAFGTDFLKPLGEFLLGTDFGFKSLPPELSAIIYLERKVLDGRIALSRNRSAVYYNPLAVQPLSLDTFPSLKRFWLQLVSHEPEMPENWICL